MGRQHDCRPLVFLNRAGILISASGGWVRGLLAVLFAVATMVGCSVRSDPMVVGDAQTAVRVRTALVNDPGLGTTPIDVNVRAGVVTLRGMVRSVDDAAHAVTLIRDVVGVVGVRSELMVDITPPPVRERPETRLPALAPLPTQAPVRLFAVGVSANRSLSEEMPFTDASAVGPIFRFRPRAGFGPTLGFTWMEARLRALSGSSLLAAVRVRPVMAGVEYRVGQGRTTAAASLVAGYAFNRLDVDRDRAGAGRAIAVGNSFAWRPGGSVWFDVTPRVGINLFAGYLFTRPELTLASDSSVVTARFTANAAIFSVGIAYWVF